MALLQKAVDRFMPKVVIGDDGCWHWTGAKERRGYGFFRVGRKTMRAYRYAYIAHIGPVEPGLELDHICRNRSCVNPDHLRQVTHTENVRYAMRNLSPQERQRRADRIRLMNVTNPPRLKKGGA